MTAPMHYVDPPDCPEGMTLRAWREERCKRPARRGLIARVRDARRARRREHARAAA
jgi:hypothetical protein